MTAESLSDEPSGSPEFYASLHRKHVAVGCVFRNDQGRILLVKPSYKAGWQLPGGAVEANESPFAACRREVLEEIGINRAPGPLLCVNYRVAVDGVRDDALRLIFDGGHLSAADEAALVVPPEEIAAWRWADLGELDGLVPPVVAQVLRACLSAPSTAYLEEGRPPG